MLLRIIPQEYSRVESGRCYSTWIADDGKVTKLTRQKILNDNTYEQISLYY